MQVHNGLRFHREESQHRAPLGTLLYIHGLGESSRCVADLTKHPGLRRWTHLVPDLVGYGASPSTGALLTLEEHAARLGELVAAGPGPVVIVGHSMGGVIGTILAEEAPERVRAFINVEGNVTDADCTYSGRVADLVKEKDLEFGVREFIQGLRDHPEPQPKDVIDRYLASVELCHWPALHHDACRLIEHSTAPLEEDLAVRLANLRVPLVYVHGQSAGGLASQSLKRLREVGIIPRPIADAGHWPFIEQTDSFVSTVGAFLDGLGPP